VVDSRHLAAWQRHPLALLLGDGQRLVRKADRPFPGPSEQYSGCISLTADPCLNRQQPSPHAVGREPARLLPIANCRGYM